MQEIKEDRLIKENQAHAPEPSSTEVLPRRGRRHFTSDYKKKILAALQDCKRGEAGAMLRREGLYFSHVETWKKQLEQGLAPKTRGRKKNENSALSLQVAKLQAENMTLARRLEQAEQIIVIQKKISNLLGLPASEERP
jgi:transposase-like protein